MHAEMSENNSNGVQSIEGRSCSSSHCELVTAFLRSGPLPSYTRHGRDAIDSEIRRTAAPTAGSPAA